MNIKEPKTYLSQERILVTDEFIERNNLSLRKPVEVLEKFTNVKDDFFGFQSEVLLDYLDWADARQFYKEEFVAEVDSGKAEAPGISDIKEAAQDFLDYMNFAWGKAEDQRGISASRSISKLSVWLWLMNREDLAEEIQQPDLYNPYGAPALIHVCEKMGIPVPESLIDFAKHPCEE